MLPRRLLPLLALLVLLPVAAGCGSTTSTADAPSDDAASTPADAAPDPDEDAPPADDDASTATDPEPAADDTDAAPPTARLEQLATRPAGEDGLRVPAARARLVVQDSQFGPVLFDGNGQVLYAFEDDRRNRSACTSEDCVTAWPPMLTKGAPTAGPGIDAAALGTITRDDGSRQVTYHGRPLYFYEHEAPGEIKCHNVNLHGGLWWVVRPDGENA
jgi:predicted lipoprotein with Yx(FWY)xxD motif